LGIRGRIDVSRRNIVSRVIESRRMIWAGDVARVGEMRNTYI